MGDKIIKSFKGFSKDMKCRDFQYKEGEEYTTDKAVACKSGFHACEYPLDVFGYYEPVSSVYHEVEQSGKIYRHNDDTKIASTKIKIGAKVDIKGLINASFDYLKERCTNSETGKDRSALNGGDMSALNGGDMSALNGGYRSALNGGDRSALNGGEESKLIGGKYSVVYGCGNNAQVRGEIGTVLALAEFNDDGELIKVHVHAVDGKIIKADTFYTLKNGKWTKVKD